MNSKKWKPYSYNGTLLSSQVSFKAKLRPRDDGKPGFRKFYTQRVRATKSPKGKAAYERRVTNGAK